MNKEQLIQLARPVAHQAFETAMKVALKSSPEKARRDSIRALDNVLSKAGRLDKAQIECRDGCSFCCYIRVVATPVEVFGLIDYLRSTLSVYKFSNFVERVDAAANTVRPMTAAEHLRTNVRCPALLDGRCIAYAARPLRCRTHHSKSANACQAEYDHPEVEVGPITWLPFRKYQGAAHIQGFEAGIEQAGFDAKPYELIAALHEALSSPTAEIEFLQGRRAFKSVPAAEE
ncbi:YkgJ family cysteine cluster protein [Pseudomonas syringae CC1417]|uniref:YkgJ family cysteine cluster protein n=2 Tax=Pseudomonas syringae TaxID=317 RepID=A0AAU8LF40_PSESX